MTPRWTIKHTSPGSIVLQLGIVAANKMVSPTHWVNVFLILFLFRLAVDEDIYAEGEALVKR